MKYRIETIVRNETPVQFATNENEYWHPHTKQFHPRQTPGAYPVTRTKGIIVDGNLGVGDPNTQRAQRIPVIPANSIRGALRRSATDIIVESLKAKGQKLSFDAAHTMLCGSSSQNISPSISISETIDSAKNVFVGLVGGGPRMVWSSYSKGIGWPIHEFCINLGLIPESLLNDASTNKDLPPSRLTAVYEGAKIDDFLRGTGMIPDWIEDFETELANQLEHTSKKKSGEDQLDDSSSGPSIRMLHYHEYILPGMRFYSEDFLSTQTIGEAGLGLYLLATERMFQKNRFGGHASIGWGRLKLERMSVQKLDDSNDVIETFDPFNTCERTPELLRKDPTVASLIEKAQTAINNLDAETITKDFGLKK